MGAKLVNKIIPEYMIRVDYGVKVKDHIIREGNRWYNFFLFNFITQLEPLPHRNGIEIFNPEWLEHNLKLGTIDPEDEMFHLILIRNKDTGEWGADIHYKELFRPFLKLPINSLTIFKQDDGEWKFEGSWYYGK